MRQQVEPWSAGELATLHEHYSTLFPQEFARMVPTLWPGRTANSVYQLAYRNGLKKDRLRVRFPRSYDSLEDGGYVSGLTDGEGCFRASIGRTPKGEPYCRVEFTLNLRADDGAILRWLKTYFGCGSVSLIKRDGNPMMNFSIGSLYNVESSVVPHFDKYPLRAKKRRDYELWRQIAEVLKTKYREPLGGETLRRAEKLVQQLTQGKKFKAVQP